MSYTNTNGCPDYIVKTHPSACSMRYKSATPLPLQMSLVGSDQNGSLLYMFSKKVRHRDHFTKRMAEAVESEKIELRSLVDGAYVQVG